MEKETEIPLDYSLRKGKIAIEHILFAVFAFLVINIVIFGYLNYRNYSKHFRLGVEKQLATIADLKSDEISQYIKERLGDGDMLFRKGSFYADVQSFLKSPGDIKNTKNLQDWLAGYITSYQYSSIDIIDTQGVLRFSVPELKDRDFCPVTAKNLYKILSAKRVHLGDFCRKDQNSHIYLSILVPILDEDENSPPLGIVIMRIDPEKYLYPFINKWPIPSKSADTLLIRRYGNEVLSLNELRFQKNTALNLRFSIDKNEHLPAVKAALGKTGIVEGIDYRGVPVMAYIRSITGLPWFIIAHIDMSEVYAPVRRQLWSIVWTIVASIIAIGAIIWYVWWRHNLLFYRTKYLAAEALRESEERYRRLFEAAKDGVLLIDFDTGRILDINPFLIELLGYPKSDMLKKYIWDINAFKNVAVSKESFMDLRAKGYMRYDDQPLESMDGNIIEVEFVSNVYLVEGKKIIQCNIRDISERRSLEKELAQARETQYRTLIENLPQKVYLKDRRSIYISCNSNYAKDLKIKPEDIAGKTDYDFFPTYLAEKYTKDDERVMESGETENIEEEYVMMKDFLRGAQKSIINTVKVPVTDKDGNVVGVFGLFWDITERKNAEAAIKESEDKYKRLFMASRDAVMTIEPPSWKFTSGNPATVEMFKAKNEKEFLSYDPWDLSPEIQPDGQRSDEKAKGLIETAVREGSTFFEWMHKRINGEEFLAEVLLSRVERDEKVFLHAVVRDITDRKNVENDRKKALNQLQGINMLQQSLLAPSMFENKIKTITDSVVRIFEADFCRVWLIKPGDLCEKGCIHAEVKEGPHVCRYRDKCLHLIASSGRYTHIDGRGHSRVPFGCYKIGLIASEKDHKFLTNDVVNDPKVHNHEWARELGLVSFAGYQLKVPYGDTIGVMALFAKHPIKASEDALLDNLSTTVAFIAQQRIVEDELKKARAIKIAPGIKSKFAPMVSREFRSPVEVIEESIDLVLQGLVGGITSAQKDILSTAKSNIDRLGRLINNVLDFQKMESGSTELDIRENDLNEVVLATSKEMNILAEEKGLNFTVNIDEIIPHLKFDKDKIAQVLINLLSNAIKFTDKGSVFVGAKHEGNVVHVMVRDTGPGIHSEDIPGLFQPAGKDRGDVNKGVGPSLGLAICKKIILAHKGKMWVESQPGKGATFHFTLPIKERRS